MVHLLLFHNGLLYCTVLCAPCAPAPRPVACGPSPSRAFPVGGRANELLLLVLGIYPGAHWPLDAPRRLRGLLPCSRASLQLSELTPGDIRVMSSLGKKNKLHWQAQRRLRTVKWKCEFTSPAVPITHRDALSWHIRQETTLQKVSRYSFQDKIHYSLFIVSSMTAMGMNLICKSNKWPERVD